VPTERCPRRWWYFSVNNDRHKGRIYVKNTLPVVADLGLATPAFQEPALGAPNATHNQI